MINAFDGRETPGGVLLRIFALAYWLVLMAPIWYGSAYVFLKAVRSRVRAFRVMETAPGLW